MPLVACHWPRAKQTRRPRRYAQATHAARPLNTLYMTGGTAGKLLHPLSCSSLLLHISCIRLMYFHIMLLLLRVFCLNRLRFKLLYHKTRRVFLGHTVDVVMLFGCLCIHSVHKNPLLFCCITPKKLTNLNGKFRQYS